MPTVALEECSKRFGERIALRRVSLAAAPGEAVVLMGANGSGKSTLLRVVAGLVRPSAGACLVNGVPSTGLSRAGRGQIGYLSHRSLAYRGLTAAENLRLVARLHRRSASAVEPALSEVGLEDRSADRIETFSRGMLQRLALARLVLAEPTLLLLDEPATGLDADGIALLDRLLRSWRGSATVLVATHDEQFADRHGDRTVRLARGEVVT